MVRSEITAPRWSGKNAYTLFRGDCAELLKSMPGESVDLTITSPPYCMGKSYEDKKEAKDFEKDHEAILPEIVRVTKNGGSICWQVGYHVSNGIVTPLDYVVYKILAAQTGIHLRNRIIWTFGHGLHSSDRFSGRHETILWFTKGKPRTFNLDAVRVPQKYPGKKHYKGKLKGEYSGNPFGKNPSDVWDIPNVKANHVEKSAHPCQFPIALAQRLITALTDPGDRVLDPYVGSGSTAAAAATLKRRFVGAELDRSFHTIASERLKAAIDGKLDYRLDSTPIYQPPKNSPLTTIPQEWNQLPV